MFLPVLFLYTAQTGFSFPLCVFSGKIKHGDNMQQIFIQQKAEVQNFVEPDAQQRHHLQRVVRMKEGEILRVIDGQGQVFSGQLNTDGRILILEQIQEDRELPVSLTLVAGLIKGERWDWLLQKCTELGVSRIVPFQSSRTVVKLDGEKVDKKQQRWQKIVQEASQQCKRTQIPQVCLPIALSEADQYLSEQNFVAYEDEALQGGLFSSLLEKGRSTTIVIGPEGGFSPAEIAQLQAQGFRCCSLGKRILRAETAAIAAVCLAAAVMEA